MLNTMTLPSGSQRLSRQILRKVLLFGVIIVTVASVICYFLVYYQSKNKTLAYLKQYMTERREYEIQTFEDAHTLLTIFRDDFLKLYLSDLDFSEDDFRELYFKDKDGAIRMKEKFFKEGIDPRLGMVGGMSSFIGNNQPMDSHDFMRRLLIANILVQRYGPAWIELGLLHASYPENAITVYLPDDPWGLIAKPDLPMNELGTIKATLQSENPSRTPVWTGLYFDETVGKWTITYEMPVDYDGRHLVNPSLDVRLESVMQRLGAAHPEGAYNFIISKDGALVAHPGELKEELKKKGQISLDEIENEDVVRMYRKISEDADASSQDISVVEDDAGGNYLLSTFLDGPGWWFVMVYPKRLISREAHQTSQIVLLLGFSLFVLFYVSTYFVISKQVRLPLQRLQQAVLLVARGEYEKVLHSPQSLPLEQRNEIGQLAGAFMDMSREVNDVNANLQSLVTSRTEELERANAKLRDLSLLDGLTGIHNRRSFDRDIARVFTQAKEGVESFSLLLADIDYFKKYNDMYGHTAGDEALRKVSEVIVASIRKSDRAYRYGGEEIAVIFNNADKEAATRTGARIIEAVRDIGLEHAGSEYGVVTISAGLLEYDPSLETATDMVSAADASLYEAKSGGRNRLRVVNDA